LGLLGWLRKDNPLLHEAVALYEGLLADEDYWSPRGRAGLLAWLGETYRLLKEWGKAEAAYARAFDAEPAGIHRVFLSECLLRQSKIGEAAETLASVKIEELHPAEQVDYAFGFATLAIETNERAKLEQAKQVLKSVKVPDPYFRERRDAFLLNVQEALASGGSPALAQRTTGLLDTVRSASPYLILKPTFMGIGIDIGQNFRGPRKAKAEARGKARCGEEEARLAAGLPRPKTSPRQHRRISEDVKITSAKGPSRRVRSSLPC
jgi:hypothetical protein